MNSNWRTNLGGAFSALGKALLGVGIIPQLSGTHSGILTYIAIAGFIFDALGSFFGHLFSADAKTVQDLSQRVELTENAAITGDTSLIERSKIEPVATDNKTP